MTRRIDRGLLALVPTLIALIVFGAARVAAPVGVIGLIFNEPLEFALVALVVGLAGTGLLFVPAIEIRVGQWMVPSRPPSPDERARLGGMLERIGARAGVRTDRLIIGVEEDPELNASAGAANLLFITTGALDTADSELEALLAHEVAHHRGLHALALALVWWLSLPGLALLAVYRLLRAAADRLTGRIRLAGLLVKVALLVWQVSVMWLYFVAQLLALGAARASEFSADRAAAGWGYGTPLARLLASTGPSPPRGLIAGLLATHPPTQDRVSRLQEAGSKAT